MSCPLCDGTGWKPVGENEANGIRRVVRCDCWRENVGRQQSQRTTLRTPPASFSGTGFQPVSSQRGHAIAA